MKILIIGFIVRDHLPLQQGLRPLSTRVSNPQASVRDHLPLQQGLRQHISVNETIVNRVRDHLPLQQGLRHSKHNP